MTALHSCSKSDTAVLLDTAVTTINVDQGPSRTNLTNNTTWLSEANSARVALAGPRSITVIVNMKSTDSGTLIQLGNLATYSWRLALAASVVTASELATNQVAVTVPGLIVTNRKIMIHWAMRVEGALHQSEMTIYNFTTGEWAFGTAQHAVSAQTATDTLTVASRTSGTSAYTGALAAFFVVHVGRRFRTATETREDWVALSSVPTSSGYVRTPMLTAVATEMTFANEGNFAGPSLLLAGSSTVQAGQRTVGSLVDLNFRTPNVERVIANPTRWYRATPDLVSGWQWCTRYLWHGYVGMKVNVAQVRVHVRAYDIGGGATISPTRFRAFSVADLPLNGNPTSLSYYRGSIASITSASATGVWLDLGTVRLARDAAGMTCFMLGFYIQTAANEGLTFNTAWTLNAITVDPFAKALTGGLGGDLDKEAP